MHSMAVGHSLLYYGLLLLNIAYQDYTHEHLDTSVVCYDNIFHKEAYYYTVIH